MLLPIRQAWTSAVRMSLDSSGKELHTRPPSNAWIRTVKIKRCDNIVRWKYTLYHGVEWGQVSCGKQTGGCGIWCNKGQLYSLFFRTISITIRSKQSQSIPKIFRNFFNYRQIFVYCTWHIRSTSVACNFTIFSTSWYRVLHEILLTGYPRPVESWVRSCELPRAAYW